MKAAIVWICAVAALCGSIDGSVIRVDGAGRGNPQMFEAARSNEDYSDSKENDVENNFDGARVEEPVQTTTMKQVQESTQRTIDPEQVLAGIQSRITTTYRPHLNLQGSSRDEQNEPRPETTTEYKYKDLVQPYIIPQPQYVPMRHVAGTHYVKVDRGQNEYDRVMEDYNRLFNRNSGSAQPDYAAPPKY
ncbi:hypothetical protein CpipJ_CPIJ006122 [Culex quinquefasciatus]|uniref:Uncharacterized protein n=1 Tax=Culex quinquefasciatus TaxID=7176 RepID=B0WGS6_CULQU|nr:uncharacterized protein LOC120418415 [Culex pipiens pallens]EDS27181.1 hypothetical protein CpipJ_CPIJ006122 [Culex quinquefasciatus]|eukprot:XP_001847910.1 hypothetical protein CpipJ_CPIJ006122 [Culex quinquefasciatus]